MIVAQHREFRRWAVPAGTSLSAFFRPGESRCGIYILEFANGERYVGQSLDIVRRTADHARRFPDIIAVQFCPLAPHVLDAAERQMIQSQRDAGHHLRNIDLVSQSWADSVLDAVVDCDAQVDWMHGGPPSHPDNIRMLIAKRRRATAARYVELTQHPRFADIFADLCGYVDRAVAWPSATDGRFWTVSVLPSTNRTREQRRLFTVSCGNVETFVMIEDRSSGEPWWFINIEHGVVERKDLPRESCDRFESCDAYHTAGVVDRIDGGAAGSLMAWFDNIPELETAARQLALGLMRKQPSLFARAHCDDVTDAIFLELDARSAPSAPPEMVSRTAFRHCSNSPSWGSVQPGAPAART